MAEQTLRKTEDNENAAPVSLTFSEGNVIFVCLGPVIVSAGDAQSLLASFGLSPGASADKAEGRGGSGVPGDGG